MNDTFSEKKRRKADEKIKKIVKAIRFTSNEFSKIEKELSRLNISFSEYARSILLKKRIRNKSKLKKELIYEINKIGNNLNQIARHTNEKKTIDLNVLKQIIEIQKNMEKLLNDC